MTAIVNSQLNPLANAFIPTKSVLSGSKKVLQHSTENEATTWEGIGKSMSDDLKSEYKIIMKLDYQDFIWDDLFVSSVSMLDVDLADSTLGETGFHMHEDVPPVLAESLTEDDQELVQKSKAHTTLMTIAEEDECNCPPMFGWIMPPDFIGNPFNFKYECSKKYPHSPNRTVKRQSDVDVLDKDTKLSQWTLDQCFSEMKEILADVYDTISVNTDPVTKWDERYKIQDYLDISDSDSSDEESNESNAFGSEFAFRTEIEQELVDDGIHPLLQSEPTAHEGEKDCVENAEKILGRSMSSSRQEYLDAPTFEAGAACDPPCSVWCDFLPPSVKDSFRKYVQEFGYTDHSECLQRPAASYRPVFKRSLSVDDAPMYSRFSRDLNHTSELESREMLLLRRKDPLNYLRIKSSSTLTKGSKYGSCDFADQQLLASCHKSSMWGKFDGADSLWQPLPECNVANTLDQKQNLKKGRETRLQRTGS